jgi:hypothetical protein
VDAVVFSDPGFEWAHTYALLPRVRRMCALHGLRLIVLQKPDPAVAAAYLRQLPPPGDPARAEAIAARPWREEEAATTIEERAEGGWYHLRPGISGGLPVPADHRRASRRRRGCAARR